VKNATLAKVEATRAYGAGSHADGEDFGEAQARHGIMNAESRIIIRL
jgi:hypothetical protein